MGSGYYQPVTQCFNASKDAIVEITGYTGTLSNLSVF
jgi:hypothetical protein